MKELFNLNPKLKSKKFAIVTWCFILIMFVYISSVACMIFQASIAAAVAQLASLVVGIFGGIVTFYITGQSIIDVKMNQNNELKAETENKKNISVQYDEKIAKSYEEKYSNDPSYAPQDWINKIKI